jgi:hypothetical protein
MSSAYRKLSRLARDTTGRARAALSAPPDDEDAPTFPALQWMTAALFLGAGAEAAIRPWGAGRAGRLDALRLAPLAAAPLAAAAHGARAFTSAPRARLATRVMDGVAAGVAMAGVAGAAYNALRPGGASGAAALPQTGKVRRLVAVIAPLGLGAAALLGLLLEHEEEREGEELRRLRRRASVVERLVPARRPRFDHIVVHV